jgi:ribonuclease J
MWLTIHRGSREIGGSCIELQSEGSRILIDFGLPLVDENRERFDSNAIKGNNKEALIEQGVLPDIAGIYRDERNQFDGILLSHAHQDHYGLLSYVNPEIPIYLSNGSKEMLGIAHFFGQTDFTAANLNAIESWNPFRLGAFTITPYLVDHSAFDALAFLIEAEGKRVFYSGDFRGHGRKSVLFENMLKRPLKDVDVLILEGSMFGRSKGKYETETELENRLVELFEGDEQLCFLACSSQNIDRLVSVYRACVRSDRIFVIDPYTAYVLDKLKTISPNIPQFDWGKNIRIFFVPNTYTEKMAQNKSLFKFKSAKITYDEMSRFRSKLVIKDTYLTRKIFAKKNDLRDTKLLYSLWNGCLPEVRPFWDHNNVPIIEVHCSGHAYVEDLQEFVKAIDPGSVIPVHTFFPEDYAEVFQTEVNLVDDGKAVEI